MVSSTKRKLYKRIIDISYKYKLSHIGSNLSSVGIIDNIFKNKQPEDIFILSSGHAALALYCIIEKYQNINAEELYLECGAHPKRNDSKYIYCSTGSLGMGITITLGRAIANKNRKVYVLISDGECAEGSVWEALKTIVELNITNIEVHVNINGYAAYKEVDKKYLSERLKIFLPNINIHYTESDYGVMSGLQSHYKVLNESEYKLMCKTYET